ncbi:MAG: sulfotransferase domain-containing protein [Candidatus Aminicenantes bacterium]|nr:sulfotransferase domain-containing protein [Candidatus Aminicenantes bacterium]
MKDKIIKYILHPAAEWTSRLPLLGQAIKRWKINRRYAIERQVLKEKHHTACTRRSILFFTVYKAGSSFLGSFMKKITDRAGIASVDLDGYFYQLGLGGQWERNGRVMVNVPYRTTGYFYGPFRSLNRGVPNYDDYKIILVLRDPRDVIVSAYYSIYSHIMPTLEGKEKRQTRVNRRKRLRELSVDEYVIEKLNSDSHFLDRYYEYHKVLMGKPNVLFLKYEDMVTDFGPWLDRLLAFLDLDVAPGLIAEIKAGADFKVSSENIYKHKRQVTPGDHKRKLKPETIDILNNKTAEVLKLYNY